MSLIRTTRRSGITLLALGVAGTAFFWLTDPRFGPTVQPGRPAYSPMSWLAAMRGSPANPIDAADDAAVATGVGVLGSLSVLGVGVYLMSRRNL